MYKIPIMFNVNKMTMIFSTNSKLITYYVISKSVIVLKQTYTNILNQIWNWKYLVLHITIRISEFLVLVFRIISPNNRPTYLGLDYFRFRILVRGVKL